MYIINILGLGPTDLLIDIFYILTIFCGISILIHKNAVISIVYFMLVYVNSSLYLYYTGYNAMPLLIILIYVGAIAILFLFILTLINVKEQEEQNKYNSSNNIIIFVNLFIIFILYTYNYCKDLLVGSQLSNILDKIIYCLNNGFENYKTSDFSMY
jgi:NADH-ubiquinone oxidoreductase chain 6